MEYTECKLREITLKIDDHLSTDSHNEVRAITWAGEEGVTIQADNGMSLDLTWAQWNGIVAAVSILQCTHGDDEK